MLAEKREKRREKSGGREHPHPFHFALIFDECKYDVFISTALYRPLTGEMSRSDRGVVNLRHKA